MPTMIARHWRGLARSDEARNYVQHLRKETFPALAKIEGFVDASILRRQVSGGVELLIVTRWASMAAIEAFAGSDPERAVVPPNVVAMMVEYDDRAKHFEVVE
jgi:heme-degrading monooxygenase HmoA